MKLEKEYRTYLEHKDELLLRSEGKFVLIKEDKVIDVFSSYEDALKEGLQRFGNVTFLVKQIQKEEDVNFFFFHVAV